MSNSNSINLNDIILWDSLGYLDDFEEIEDVKSYISNLKHLCKYQGMTGYYLILGMQKFFINKKISINCEDFNCWVVMINEIPIVSTNKLFHNILNTKDFFTEVEENLSKDTWTCSDINGAPKYYGDCSHQVCRERSFQGSARLPLAG